MGSDSPSKDLFQELAINDKPEEEWGSPWPIKEGEKSPCRKEKRKADSDDAQETSKQKKHRYDPF